MFVLAEPASDTLETMEPQKCEGWEWFEWSDLPEPLFAPIATLRSQGLFSKTVSRHCDDGSARLGRLA